MRAFVVLDLVFFKSNFILMYLFSYYPPCMALNGLQSADVPLRNYSLNLVFFHHTKPSYFLCRVGVKTLTQLECGPMPSVMTPTA